jgi:hypothetical protein
MDIELTKEQLETLRTLSEEEIEDLAAELDERISKLCSSGTYGGLL